MRTVCAVRDSTLRPITNHEPLNPKTFKAPGAMFRKVALSEYAGTWATHS